MMLNGPPSNDICLSAGSYKLIIFNKSGNESESANYAGYLDGKKMFGSPAGGKWERRVHKFTISAPATPKPTPTPTKPPTTAPTHKPSTQTEVNDDDDDTEIDLRGTSCKSSQRKVKVEIKTDKFGADTSWGFINASGRTLYDSGNKYGSYESDTRLLCLKKGAIYDFYVRDNWGDGMCCAKGDGYFKVSLLESDGSWREVLSGGSFRTKLFKQSINLVSPTMNQRDVDWLDSHNNRREKWHTSNGVSFVPLRWSSALRDEAAKWAERLLADCGKGMWHDPENHQYGENVAGNSGSGSWGAQRSTEDVLTRFVEREENKPYPHNGHLTQVLWRASRYVGCADAAKPYGNNGMCRTQVCRYAVSGNCNMGAYKNANSDDWWWLEPMLMEKSSCGNECPPDGKTLFVFVINSA
jgi:hypothetical protein